MKLLFISRAYPPIIGGMEKHNQALHEALQQKAQIKAIINYRGKIALPWFIPLAAVKVLLFARRYNAILLGDGVLSVVGWLVKLLHPRTPVICIVHGLDITYTNPIYQLFWGRVFLPAMDRVIAVSRATASEAVKKGIAESKLSVIPNGIHPVIHQNSKDRKKLEALLGLDTENKTILLTVGRLVKRKGINWFIQQVMPNIADKCIYLVAGDGPEKTAIDKSLLDNDLGQSVHSFGRITEEIKFLLFSTADLFIQPNIKVDGDMEGFGITVLEANLHYLPVLGSNLEGLQDSIMEERNGWLLEPENADEYIQKIKTLSKSSETLKNMGDNAREYCLQHFCWEHIAQLYMETIEWQTTQSQKTTA